MPEPNSYEDLKAQLDELAKDPMNGIKHVPIHLVGDDVEDEETLAIMQFKKRVELEPREAVKFARKTIRDLKSNITDLEREILWVTDRERYMSYYEDRKTQ